MWMNGRNNRQPTKNKSQKEKTMFCDTKKKNSKNQTIMIWMEKMCPANSNRASVYAYVYKIYYKLFVLETYFFKLYSNCKATQATCLFRSAFLCPCCIVFFSSIKIKTMKNTLNFVSTMAQNIFCIPVFVWCVRNW